MQIAVDAMGGDNSPGEIVRGAFDAVTHEGVSILLVGRSEPVESELAKLGSHGGRIEVVNADDVVGMDESATSAIRKRNSSIRLCCQLVRDGRAQAMVSAGNTGAVMIAAKMVIGAVKGVDRPALAAVLPSATGRTVLLDVGANVDSKAALLRQFAVMGHFYAQELLGREAPRIGLLSIGEEEIKGSELTREVFRILETTGLNFVGNVEGGDVFNGSVDVVVCDGFVGNVVLKSAEALAGLIQGMLKSELDRSWRTRVGRFFARPAFARLMRNTDSQEFGAVPLLGVRGGCFIAHGRSEAKAIRSSIAQAIEFCAADLHNKIQGKVAQLHEQEEKVLGRLSAEEISAS